MTVSSAPHSSDAAGVGAKPILVMGNWKMNGSLASNAKLLADLRAGFAAQATKTNIQFAVCVPAPYLTQTSEALTGSAITYGAQDVSAHEAGAYTGEVAAYMLKDFACDWVLVGHSERRSMHGESSQLVADKANAALTKGITPVVCVGESLAERDAGQVHEVIAQQLAPVIALGAESLNKMVIAYEPVWAIGTGRTASPEQAQEVHAGIRKALHAAGTPAVKVLYGGSVKASNAASLFAMPDIDGALVGGASLIAEEFLRIGA